MKQQIDQLIGNWGRNPTYRAPPPPHHHRHHHHPNMFLKRFLSATTQCSPATNFQK